MKLLNTAYQTYCLLVLRTFLVKKAPIFSSKWKYLSILMVSVISVTHNFVLIFTIQIKNFLFKSSKVFQLSFFHILGFVFTNTDDSLDSKGRVRPSLNSSLPVPPLRQHLDIKRAISEELTSAHNTASSRTRPETFRFRA